MLTGEPPYRSDETVKRLESAGNLEERLTLYRQSIERAPRPIEHRKVSGVNRFLADIIDRCLAPRPDRRYSNVQAVLSDLEEWQRRKARLPVILLATLLPALVILVGAYFAYDGFQRAMGTSQTALTERTEELHRLAATYAAPAVTDKIHIRWNRLSREASFFGEALGDAPAETPPPGAEGPSPQQDNAAGATPSDKALDPEFARKCKEAFRQVHSSYEPKSSEYALDVLRKAMHWAKESLKESYKSDPESAKKIEARLRDEPEYLLNYAEGLIKSPVEKERNAGQYAQPIIENWVALQDWLAHARRSLNRSGDLSSTSWLLMNDRGDQIARDPIDVDTVFENYAWREYFHGQDALGDLEPDQARGVRPTGMPHLTRRPFTSLATNHSMVAFSVPIQMRVKDQAGNERIVVAGVLAMTVEFGEFSELQHNNPKIFTSLVYAPPKDAKDPNGQRGALLEHPSLRELGGKNEIVPSYFVDEQLLGKIDEMMQKGSPYRAQILLDYQDPVEASHDRHEPWMATMYPVVMDRRPTDWVVVVQEKQADALAPVYDLQRQLLAQGVVALISIVLAVIAAWLFAALMLQGHTRSRFVNALRHRMGLTGARGTTSTSASGGRTARRPGKTPTSRSAGR
jgi:hypothetical protein